MQSFTYGTTPPRIIRQALKNQLGEKKYEISCIAGEMFEVIKLAVNQGIDGYLEAVTDSDFREENGRFFANFAHEDLLVLLRRLKEIGETEDSLAEEASSLRSGILMTLEIEEI
jgi:hypothetical protein